MLSCRRWLLLAAATAAAAPTQQAAAFVVSQASQLIRGVSTLATSQAAVRPVAAAATTAANASASTTSSNSSSHTLEGEAIQGPLRPLRGMVLLQKLQAETTTPGGLLLPTDSRKEQLIGRVLSAGPGDYQPDTGKRIAVDVKEGDLVVFSRHSGEALKYDGADCVLLAGSDLLAKVADPQSLRKEDVRPLGDTVFVRVLKPAEKSAGGLLLLQQQERLLQQAVVVAVGPGKFDKHAERIPIEVSVGDRVLYSSYAEETSQLKIGEDVFAFVRAAELAAKF